MKLDRDRRSQIRRESMENARGRLRCPACYMIQDCTLKGFACSLSRCPRIFVDIAPRNGSQPAVPVGLEVIGK